MSQPRFLHNPADLPRTAEVVIVGGGPAGAAAAWAVERAAPGTRVVVLEAAGSLAAGASLASLENFRTCWPTPCLKQMLARSVEVFLNADDYLGAGARAALGIKQQGYVYVGFNPEQAAALRRDVEHLQRIGLAHVEFLEAAEAAYRFPWLGPRVIAAKYDPLAGWLDSNALVYRLAAASGAQFVLNARAARIVVQSGRVTGVATAAGTVAAPQALVAAGAHSRALALTAGIDLPVALRPRQSFTTAWRDPAIPPTAPCVISAAPFPHLRPEAGDGAIFGWEYHWRAPDGADALAAPDRPADAYKDPRFPSLTLGLLARHFGHRSGQGFADPRYLKGIWHRAGYYVYRANAAYIGADGARRPYASQRAIIDRAPGVDGLCISTAHVGHGIMSAPAAGEIAAAQLLGQPLPDPLYADFGLDVTWVEHDGGGLGG